jgi:hypothetical protein
MVTVDPITSTGRPGGAPAPSRGRGVRITRLILTGLWLVGVPAVAGVWVDQHFGKALGTVPLFWLDGTPPGPSVTGTLALLAAAAVAVTLHRLRAIALLALLPAFVAWIGYVGFGGGVGGWLGLLAGLGAGGLAYGWRRRQGR